MSKLPPTLRRGVVATLTVGRTGTPMRVRIEDITPDDVIMLDQPTQGGRPVMIPRGEMVKISAMSDGYTITIDAEYVGIKQEPPLVFCNFRTVSVDSQQRRAFHRLQIRLAMEEFWYWKGVGDPVKAGIAVGAPPTENAHEIAFEHAEPVDAKAAAPKPAPVKPSPAPAKPAPFAIGPRVPQAPGVRAAVAPVPVKAAEPEPVVHDPNRLEGVWEMMDGVVSYDYSGGGVGFVVPRPLPLGTWVSACFELPEDLGKILVTGQVRTSRRRYLSDPKVRSYIVGIHLAHVEKTEQERLVRSIFKVELEQQRKVAGE